MPTASTQIDELRIPMTSTTALAGFAELYECHSEAVFRAALRVTGNPADAEDVLQTVFLRVLARGGVVEDVALPPAYFWDAQPAFERILGQAPRILVASFLAYLVGEFVNAYVLARLKVAMEGRMLWVRTIGSTAENGSSISSTTGSAASARATPTRCRCPPESSCG